MSPIIELQRRMVEAGRIRAGDKGPKGEPRKGKNWRLTSKDQLRLGGASRLWGGEVRPWEGHEGEWELYTETDSLPIMLLPGALPTTWYELWSKGGCQRRCDGVHEIISDGSCICDPDERECKPYTRLSVMLPDLPGIGSWLLTSTGWNAAAELGGTADLLQRASAQGMLVPARLRLQQETSVKAGQTRRFVKPVIDIDVSVRELLGAQGGARTALPSGYTPIPPATGNGVSLSEGLQQAETQVTKPPRVPLPDDDVEDDVPVASSPRPSPLDGAPAPISSPVGNTIARSTRDKPATEAQISKLGVIVRWLRPSEISTVDLYNWVARHRSVDVATMTDLTEGAFDTDGVLHWGPLLATLTRAEASALIDALTVKYGEPPKEEK